MSEYRYVLGVDGGGSHVRAWIALLQSDQGTDVEPLGSGESSSANVGIVGSQVAEQNTLEAIHQAVAAASIDKDLIAAACLGMAGAGAEVTRAAFESWAVSSGIAPRVLVTHDAEIALQSVTSDRTGIVLIAGTGSFAWGRNPRGDSFRVGGWGPLLGDDGGGFSIGRDALRHVADQIDRRAPWNEPPDVLTRLVAVETGAQLNLNNVAAGIDALRLAGRSVAAVASFAPLVLEAARQDDAAARRILDRHAARLAALAEHSIRWIVENASSPKPPVLALSGSLLTQAASYREQVLEHLDEWAIDVRIADRPVAGAIRMARDLAAN